MKQKFRAEVLNVPDMPVNKVTIHRNMLYRSTAGMEWVDENKELVVNGIFNEVVRVVITGDSAVVHLVEDRQESRLYSQFLHNDDESGRTRTLYQLLLSLQATLPRGQHAVFPGVKHLSLLAAGLRALQPGHVRIYLRPPLA